MREEERERGSHRVRWGEGKSVLVKETTSNEEQRETTSKEERETITTSERRQ